MRIDFYFDPSCPWCWVTSRWLEEVRKEREIEITWIGFSLAIKNNELEGEDVTGHLDTHTIAHRVLRIIEAIAEKENIDRGKLYTEFGRAYFIDKTLDDEIFIQAVLEKLNLDPGYFKEGDNEKFDSVLENNIKQATDIVGDDVGVPLIIFENENGEKQGFFGPVLQGLPEKQEGLDLFDGLVKFATNSKFFELKRTRRGRSKVKTTKRVFEESDNQ